METVNQMPSKRRNKRFSQTATPGQRRRKSIQLYLHGHGSYELIPLVAGICSGLLFIRNCPKSIIGRDAKMKEKRRENQVV